MAIYHLSVKVIGRSRGQSAIAAAAYRSGERLTDEATGEIKHYRSRAERIVFTGIFAPADAPAWARDRGGLWNAAERAEARKDATLAREIELALPHELTGLQRRWLVQDFVCEALVRRGLAADVAIHAPDRGGDRRNHHAHILITERGIGPDGFAAKKDRSLYSKTVLRDWRRHWQQLCNRHLARHGQAARIDCRSLQEQGSCLTPTRHLGAAVTQMQRRGVATDRGRQHRAIRAGNARSTARQAACEVMRRVSVAAAAREAAGSVQPFAQMQAQTPARQPRPQPPPRQTTAWAFGRAGKGFVSRAAPLPPSMPLPSPDGLVRIERPSAAQAAREESGLQVLAVMSARHDAGAEPVRDAATIEPESDGEPCSYEAEVMAVMQQYGIRIDGLRRSLPPEQARAAVMVAQDEMRAVLVGIRERRARVRPRRRQRGRVVGEAQLV